MSQKNNLKIIVNKHLQRNWFKNNNYNKHDRTL